MHKREGLVLWSISIQRDPEHVQQLQAQFSNAAAGVLRCALSVRHAAQEDPASDLMSKFLHWCAAARDGRLEQTPELARHIVDSSPQYGVSFALQALSNAWASSIPGLHWESKPPGELERLRKIVYDSARTALAIDPKGVSGACAYWALATVDDSTVGWAKRETFLQKALSLGPDAAAIYQSYAQFLMRVGRFDEARAYFMRQANIEWSEAPIVQAAKLAAFGREINDGRDQFKEIKDKALDSA